MAERSLLLKLEEHNPGGALIGTTTPGEPRVRTAVYLVSNIFPPGRAFKLKFSPMFSAEFEGKSSMWITVTQAFLHTLEVSVLEERGNSRQGTVLLQSVELEAVSKESGHSTQEKADKAACQIVNCRECMSIRRYTPWTRLCDLRSRMRVRA